MCACFLVARRNPPAQWRRWLTVSAARFNGGTSAWVCALYHPEGVSAAANVGFFCDVAFCIIITDLVSSSQFVCCVFTILTWDSFVELLTGIQKILFCIRVSFAKLWFCSKVFKTKYSQQDRSQTDKNSELIIGPGSLLKVLVGKKILSFSSVLEEIERVEKFAKSVTWTREQAIKGGVKMVYFHFCRDWRTNFLLYRVADVWLLEECVCDTKSDWNSGSKTEPFNLRGLFMLGVTRKLQFIVLTAFSYFVFCFLDTNKKWY